MEAIYLPTERDFKQWIKEAIAEYFTSNQKPNIGSDEAHQEPLLNRKQIAAFLNISLVTLHKRMKKGLPFHKNGGRVYFLRSEVVQYVLHRKRRISKKRIGPVIELPVLSISA